jgi:hypothetical protein
VNALKGLLLLAVVLLVEWRLSHPSKPPADWLTTCRERGAV